MREIFLGGATLSRVWATLQIRCLRGGTCLGNVIASPHAVHCVASHLDGDARLWLAAGDAKGGVAILSSLVTLPPDDRDGGNEAAEETASSSD